MMILATTEANIFTVAIIIVAFGIPIIYLLTKIVEKLDRLIKVFANYGETDMKFKLLEHCIDQYGQGPGTEKYHQLLKEAGLEP